jgi:hypothetical protein
MAWLRASLERNMASGASATTAVLSTFEEWWNRPDYRGCAFINSAAELGSSDPEILEIVRQHKADMTSVFEKLLLRGPGRAAKARALALAIDGAIVHAQMGIPVASLLVTLKALVEPVLGD